MSVTTRVIGAAVDRIEGREKVTGAARYAYEYAGDEVAYAMIVAASVAKGRIESVDAEPALALPGVKAVLWHENAPRLHEVDDAELAILQSDRVAYRGGIVAVAVADSFEIARQAARLVRVRYVEESHDVLLREDHPGLYKPEKVNPSFPTDTD
jgi:xanthine dehydrogenase YagR molybdenum-binding subunit